MHEGHDNILDEEKLGEKGCCEGHDHDSKKEKKAKIFATLGVVLFLFYMGLVLIF